MMWIVFGYKVKQVLFWNEASGVPCRQELESRDSVSRPGPNTLQATSFGKYVNFRDTQLCHLENDSKITSVGFNLC